MTSVYDWIVCPYCGETENVRMMGADDGSIGFACDKCNEKNWQ